MEERTLLVTLSGTDRPGVTSRLFGVLAAHRVEVQDIEQIVVRGQLVLAALLRLSASVEEKALRAAIEPLAVELGLHADLVLGSGDSADRPGSRVTVTLLGAPLLPGAVAAVADRIAAAGGNIDRIRRMAAYPVTAIALDASGADVHGVRRALAQAASEAGADVAVQADGLDRRGQHLMVLDVDSTLIADEVIDLLAEEAGVHAEVAAITERAMAGELDFEAALRARVALLEGLPQDALSRVLSRVRMTPGARTLCRTLRRLGYRVCLVSGGFTEVVAPIGEDLGADGVRANSLEIADGRLTGRLLGPIVDRAGKRHALEAFAAEFGIPMRRTIAVGDGANDVDMLEAAGLGIAFNGKPAAREAADAAVSVPYLDSILYLLGITRAEIEEADADAGYATPAPPTR